MNKKIILKLEKLINYHFISYKYKLFRNNQNNLLATMPKSGTWYCQYFFWSLSKILEDENFNILKYKFKKFEVSNIVDIKIKDIKKRILIGHATCPGYEFEKNDSNRSRWEKLDFWHNGFNWANRVIKKNYCPQVNSDTKIVYIYREPLEQIFSSYNYAKKHIDKYQRKCAEQKLIDFYMKTSAVDSYIKQFHTFKYMQKIYPQNIKLIKYSDLISNPNTIFLEICNFYGIPISNYIKQDNFNLAIKSVQKENLSILETKNNFSLAYDGDRDTHIQGNKYGSYEKYLTKNDIKEIEKIFNRFSYSLKDF